MEPFSLGLQNRPRPRPRCVPACDPPAPLAILGLVWRHLGLSWGHLGAILGLPGATLPLHNPADPSQHFLHLRFVDAKCLFLESSYLGCFQSYCWRILGAILGNLGLSCSHLGAILGYIGPILGPSRAFLGLSWPSLGHILRNAKFALANCA